MNPAASGGHQRAEPDVGVCAEPNFYNGLPISRSRNFTSLTNTTPAQDTINQTISFSDFVSWRHKKHNFRFGVDVRRVHAGLDWRQ